MALCPHARGAARRQAPPDCTHRSLSTAMQKLYPTPQKPPLEDSGASGAQVPASPWELLFHIQTERHTVTSEVSGFLGYCGCDFTPLSKGQNSSWVTCTARHCSNGIRDTLEWFLREHGLLPSGH